MLDNISTSKNSKYRFLLLFVSIMLISLSILSCTAFKVGWQTGEYKKLGWLPVIQNDTNSKNGYKRLQEVMQISKNIEKFIARKGYPDYLRVKGSSEYEFAYLQEGMIYQFGGFISHLEDSIHFSKHHDLTKTLLEAFVNSAEEPEWQLTQNTNTIEAYEAFLHKYPKSTSVKEARIRIETLEWQKVQTLNNVSAYNAFIQKYPKGIYAQDASKRIEELANREMAQPTDTITANEVSVQKYPDETGTVTDIDGNVYKTIKIGNQVWMAENLKVTHYRNGVEISEVSDKNTWSDLETGAYCCFKNDPTNIETYGLLYNWYAVTDSNNIAPKGWHVPTDEDWKELEMFLGMSQDEVDKTPTDTTVLFNFTEIVRKKGRKAAFEYLERGTNEGSKLKSTSGWKTNENATNTTGFSALPGGQRDYKGNFAYISLRAHFWTSSISDPEVPILAATRFLDCNKEVIERAAAFFESGLSVRCVKD